MHQSRTAATVEQLRRMPKVELHCHLEGSIPPDLALDIAQRNGVPLPTDDPDALYRFTGLEDFLAIYVALCEAVKKPVDMAEITYGALTSAAAEGLKYREMSFNPTNHPAMSYRQALDGVLDGVRSAKADTGVECRLLVAINREHSADTAIRLVRDALENPAPEVVGIGLDHNELVGPPGRFQEAYALAAHGGLRRTAHAGERGDVHEVWDVLNVLGAERIDHGYAALKDQALIDHCRKQQIHFATCWTTQLIHNGDDRAMRGLIDAGLSVSISPDDPPMMGSSTGTEFERAATTLGWSVDQAASHVLEGMRAAFCEADQRDELVAAIEDDMRRLEDEASTAAE